MARTGQSGATPVVGSSEYTPRSPSLKPIFEDIIAFAGNIIQNNSNASQVLQGLNSQYYRDQLGRLEQLRHQIKTIVEDILDLGTSNFDGLRRMFREPECIVLDQLRLHLSKMDSNWRQTCDISRLTEDYGRAIEQKERFEVVCTSISGRITTTKDDLDLIGNSSLTSTLCPSALRWINGLGSGSVEPAVPSTEDEKDILRKVGGRYHKWRCPDCPRKIKFYVKTTDPTLQAAIFPARVHDKVNNINVKWRDMWCAKSHLAPGAGARYACLLCLGQGKTVEIDQTAFNDDIDLARHIGLKHKSDALPMIFMRKLHITRKSDDDAANMSGRNSNEMGRKRSDLRLLLE